MVAAGAYLASATGLLIVIRGGEPPAPPVEHDYSADYLTFRVLTPGTISWKAVGGLTKTIEYSIDNGAWTSITSTSEGATISVAQGNLVRFRGSNTAYATSKSAYSGFGGEDAPASVSATYDIEGNIMSLLYGDNFSGSTTLPNSNFIFCSLFKKAPVISAEHLILPATALKNYCYRALFSKCTTLTKAPELPATTLATGCYWYMFEECPITEAPALNASTLVQECYGHMFEGCVSLNTIECYATSGFSATNCRTDWVKNVAASGTFVKSSDATGWTTGASGIPSGWKVRNDSKLLPPGVSFDGETIELDCPTEGAEIYYKVGQSGSFAKYTAPFAINSTVVVQAYSTIDGKQSDTVTQTCEYDPGHDYSADYLTFRVRKLGTISWKSFGDLAKTIEYSIDGGAWTSITSTSEGATISAVQGNSVRVRGTNTTYATSKDAYSGFEGGTAIYDIEGNIMSLLHGDDFSGITTLPDGDYIFCSLFKKAPVISAKYLILPATTLKNYCYRSLFSYCTMLIKAPELPAMTLAKGCYWYMFEQCAITKAPTLNASTLVNECYGHMFTDCESLNTITCLATSGFNASNCLLDWVKNVASNGVFLKAANVTWNTGVNGIPEGWLEDVLLLPPEVSFYGDTIELECDTVGAEIHYRLGQTGDFALYTGPIAIVEDTIVEAYSTYRSQTSQTVTQTCVYVHETPFQRSNKELLTWRYDGNTITTPYSVNATNGHSASYSKGTFAFDTFVTLRAAQPTYLWFQHADQSADIYVNDVKVGAHWGGYNAFFFDISEYVRRGRNDIRVALCNTTRNTLAPADGDFNFNATLGNVKLFTSQVLPAMEYGYDGFHITSTVSGSSATINVKTSVPVGASLTCTISDGDRKSVV